MFAGLLVRRVRTYPDFSVISKVNRLLFKAFEKRNRGVEALQVFAGLLVRRVIQSCSNENLNIWKEGYQSEIFWLRSSAIPMVDQKYVRVLL